MVYLNSIISIFLMNKNPDINNEYRFKRYKLIRKETKCDRKKMKKGIRGQSPFFAYSLSLGASRCKANPESEANKLKRLVGHFLVPK